MNMEANFPLFKLCFSKSCLRICLVFDSLILWVQGAGFLLLGVFIHNFIKNFFTDGRGLKVAGGFPIASIILGIAMVSVGLLINFINQYPTKLRYFGLSFLLMAIFAFEIVYFIAGFEYAQTIERVLKDGYQEAMINYNEGFIVTMELNTLQWMLQCCGADDFMDWYNTLWAGGKMQVPESCCIDVKYCHNLEPVMVDDINKIGCNNKISRVIRAHNMALILSITCAAITQILGIILSVRLGVKEMESRATASQRPIIQQT